MGNKKNFSILKKMKKIIITSSMLALFTTSVIAQDLPLVVTKGQTVSYSDIIYTNNDGLTSPAIDVNAGGSLTLDNVNISDNSIAVPDVYSALVKVYTSANLTLKNSEFNNNFATHSSTPNGDVSGSVLNLTIGNTGGATNVGIINIEDTVFDSNKVSTTRQAFGNIYTSNPVSATLKNVTISNNIAGDNSTLATYSAGYCAYGIGHTAIENASFTNNIAKSYYWVDGGAIYARAVYSVWRNYDVSLKVSNSTFDGNASILEAGETPREDNDSRASGGAIYIRNSETKTTTYYAELADSTFKNNYVSIDKNIENNLTAISGGGAIFVDANGVKISATEDILNVGNYVDNRGIKDDSMGGFLYLNSRTNQGNPTVAEFAISQNATMTIGNGTAGYDSIAGDASSTINKTGAGSLVVNSSMEYFTGTLNVNAGTMDANNGLGAKAVNIASGATLNVGLTSTSLTSATVVNDGILGLKRGTLADGDTLTISSYSGEGTVNAFGGSFANGVFTAGKSTEFTNNVITVGSAENDVQTVSFVGADNNKLVLDFNVSGKETMTVNNITEVSEAENIVGDFITGFSVDATYNGDLSVVLSAYVGDISNPANLVAWHKADGSNIWTKLDGEIEYDASTGFASIFVEGFSSYAFSQVPEPSTYALILGVLALSLAMYRRRR